MLVFFDGISSTSGTSFWLVLLLLRLRMTAAPYEASRGDAVSEPTVVKCLSPNEKLEIDDATFGAPQQLPPPLQPLFDEQTLVALFDVDDEAKKELETAF